MGDQGKNVIIGVFVLVACAIVVFIILFLHPSVGNEGQLLYVRFSDIDKVNVGTRVTFAGKAVGEVTDIREIKNGREGMADSSGHLYVYELTLSIDTGVQVYSTDEIMLRTSGLLGERSVAIIPVLPPADQKLRLVTSKDILYAAKTGSVEETMGEFKEVADKFDIALDQITSTMQDLKKEELIKKIADTAQNLNEITAALNEPEELSNILSNLVEFTTLLSSRLSASWDTLDETLQGFNATANNVRSATDLTKQLVVNVGEGKGSFGKILADDTFYLELKAILGKVDTLANDVNHYGLLFHLDKGWQRLRARRLNLLQKLTTPQEFRNYFNDEVDQISTSLSRVAMVLDKVETYCPCEILAEDKDYTKVFSELLRRLDLLEEGLKMYNQQVMDCEIKRTELSADRQWEACR